MDYKNKGLDKIAILEEILSMLYTTVLGKAYFVQQSTLTPDHQQMRREG